MVGASEVGSGPQFDPDSYQLRLMPATHQLGERPALDPVSQKSAPTPPHAYVDSPAPVDLPVEEDFVVTKAKDPAPRSAPPPWPEPTDLGPQVYPPAPRPPRPHPAPEARRGSCDFDVVAGPPARRSKSKSPAKQRSRSAGPSVSKGGAGGSLADRPAWQDTYDPFEHKPKLAQEDDHVVSAGVVSAASAPKRPPQQSALLKAACGQCRTIMSMEELEWHAPQCKQEARQRFVACGRLVCVAGRPMLGAW